MDKPEFLVIGIACAAAAIWLLYENTADASELLTLDTPRGIRNNNPMNLVYIATDPYNGQTGKDSEGYGVYSSWQLGVRAAGKQLDTFYNEGKTSVSDLANAWSTDGHPGYENYVAAQIGVPVDETLPWPDDQLAYVMAAIHFENGENPYASIDVQAALNS